jgi:DNA primase
MNSIQELLKEYDIPYWERGKNVARGHINIQCPYHKDNSNHFGIRLSDSRSSCYVCGSHSLIKTLEILTKLPYSQIKEIISKFQTNIPEEKIHKPIPGALDKYFRFFNKDILGPYYDYLEKRGFDPYHLQNHYGIMSCGNMTKFKFRIIIPIVMNNQIVSFSARDITGQAINKYDSPPDSENLIPRDRILYNLNHLEGDSVLIVEGPTDVWKIGDGTIATLSTKFTYAQLLLLLKKGIKNLFVLYDPEDPAQIQAQKLASLMDVATSFDHVERLELCGYSDPGSLSVEDAKQIRKEVFGK